MDYLNRIDLIEFILDETYLQTEESDFDEDRLDEELADATNEELLEMAKAYGWRYATS